MRPTSPSRRTRTIAAVAALLLLPPLARVRVQAQDAGPGATIERVSIGFSEAVPGQYKVATWTPVFVEVRSAGGPFRGLVEVIAPDDDGLPTSARFAADVGAGQSSTVVAYARPGTLAAEVTVRLLSEDGRRDDGRAPVRLAPEPLGLHSRVVLAAGSPSGLSDVTKLEKYLGDPSRSADLVVSPLQAFPDHAFGYDGADVIVLETGDQEARRRLGQGASRALRDWVARGGHLVISLDPNPQEAVGLLGDLMPATVGEPVRLSDPDAVETFAGGRGRGISGPLSAVRLSDLDSRGGIPLAATPLTPVIVRGPYGLGRVTLIGIDTAGDPFASWTERRQFWDRVLDLRSPAEEDLSIAGLGIGRGAIIQSAAPELGARLHRSLESFSGVTIVPFGWVAFFVFLYILLIGPIDYFFLRKIVKRMELTWITFPLTVALVSVLAFAGAYAFKGRELRVNKVDALDFDQTTGEVRGQTWLTVFSPANQDYALSVQPRGPSLDASEGGTIDLAEQTVGWFSSPEPILGGLGRVSFGQSGYGYPTTGDVSKLAGVRVPIWSTKSFTGRWSGKADGPVLQADLAPTGGDRLAGSVRNLTSQTLVDAQLYYGRNVYSLGTIRPGGIARVDPSRAEATSRSLGRIAQVLRDNLDQAASGTGSQGAGGRSIDPRADILRAAMFHTALGDRGGLIPGRSLRHLDLYAQASELRRPIFLAEVEAPAAALDLQGASIEPDVTQTTLLRVIVPMGQDPSITAAP